MLRHQTVIRYISQARPALLRLLSVALLAVWGLSLQLAGAQEISPAYEAGNIEIEPTGALWLEGSASVVDYRCYAESLAGSGEIENTTEPTKNVQGQGDVKVKVTIPVKALECGKSKMNRDLYEALKAEEHPSITYQLLQATLLSESTHPDSAGWMKIQTEGLLTIAGVTDTTSLVVEGQLVGQERFRVKGVKPLNMHDFDIEPPTALMGLIKANEKLTVHFDVSVHLNGGGE
ncbi:YceI family protein [Halalkalibaculum sp. DA384]|uniref:YceI family protein n=1 Tax=Halalkalibaculum sp. DA384 TaxID=3373606 RepID=UPI0037544B53